MERTFWKSCNLTPAFSLPSFLFASQTHRRRKVAFFTPVSVLWLAEGRKAELTSYFRLLARCSRLLLKGPVLFFFSFLLLGRGLTRLQGCIQTLWPKTSGAWQDIMKHDLMQRYHPHLCSDGLMIHSNTSDKGGDFFTTFLTCRFDHSYLLFFCFCFFFWLATADKLQWVGWNLICDNFGFTVM